MPPSTNDAGSIDIGDFAVGKKIINLPVSRGFPSRPIGIVACVDWVNSPPLGIISKKMVLGQRVFIRMYLEASSFAIGLVKADTAALLTA